MQVDRHIRNLLLTAALLATSAGAQDGESQDLPDPVGPATDDVVIDEAIVNDETFQESESLDLPDPDGLATDDVVIDETIVEGEAFPEGEPLDLPDPDGPATDDAVIDEAIVNDETFQEGESLDLPDPDGPVLDDMVFEEKVFEDDDFADESMGNQATRGPSDKLVPVADDPADADDAASSAESAEPATELSDVEMLVQEFGRYKALMDNGIYDEADTVAKRVVELSLKATGPMSLETARALTNLAVVQYRNKQYDTAQQNYLASIEIIEVTDNRLSKYLVNPLKGLGAAQLEGGQPGLAIGTYKRAVHLTHVNEGPHNLDQLELLQSLAEASLRLGDTKEAKDLQDRMYLLNVRHFSQDSMGLIPTLVRRAEWQHRAGMIIDERVTYRRIIQIIEKNEGKNGLSLISPLIAYGRSFLFADLTRMSDVDRNGLGTGEIYFRRAVRIAGKNPQADWKDRAVTTLALGDYYMNTNNESRGRKVYSEAWDMLSVDEEGLEFRRDMLERPYVLRDRPMPKYMSDDAAASDNSSDSPERLLTGTLALSYDVNEHGRVSTLRVIEAEPPEFTEMRRAVQRNLQSRNYRPRFADGEPAVSTDQILVHTFYYRQADLDAVRVKVKETGAPQEPSAPDPG
jgi:tetratricopeptide (TPR) repeat protein